MEYVSNLWVGTGVAAETLSFNSPQAVVHHARRMPATAARREGRAWRINPAEFAAELRRRRLALLPLRVEVQPAPGARAGTAVIALDGATCRLAWCWEGDVLVLEVQEAGLAPEIEARVRDAITAAPEMRS